MSGSAVPQTSVCPLSPASTTSCREGHGGTVMGIHGLEHSPSLADVSPLPSQPGSRGPALGWEELKPLTERFYSVKCNGGYFHYSYQWLFLL